MVVRNIWVITLLMAGWASAHDLLKIVIERLAQGSADEKTVAVLQEAVQRDSNAPAWWAWLGFAHALRHEWQRAEQAYAKARSYGAQLSFAWFPPTLPLRWLPGHGGLQPISIGDATFWCSPSVFTEPKSFQYPEHGDQFHHIAFVYGMEGYQSPTTNHPPSATTVRQWVQWLTVLKEVPPHVQDVPVLFALALQWFKERLGTSVSLPVRLWLFPQGNGSAFTVTGNTLFYGTKPDDLWLWYLKVGHEAGHHAVPAFGEFSGMHEPYAGGFLGERLFALWLWDTVTGRNGEVAKGGNGDVKSQQLIPHPLSLISTDIEKGLTTYLRQTVVPEMVLAQQWLLAGFSDKEPAMQVFLGLCLFLERLGGVSLLRDAMTKADSTDWAAFQRGVAATITERLSDGLTLRFACPDANTSAQRFDLSVLRGGIAQPSVQLAWWLPVGEVHGKLLVQGKGQLMALWGEQPIGEWSVSADEPQPLSMEWSVRRTGWECLRFLWRKGSGKIVALTLRKN